MTGLDSTAGAAPCPGPPTVDGLIGGDDPVLPLFLPGAVLSLVVAILVSGPVARALATRRFVAILLVLSVGAIVSATLTPLGGTLVFDGGAAGACDLSRLGPPPLGALRRLTDTSLNVALFVPLGLAIALLPRTRRTGAVLAGAILFPVVIEATQLLVPAISRGCESADVIDNLLGLAVGLGVGVALRALARAGGRVPAASTGAAAPGDHPSA